jgi:hypothetical protein
MGKYHCTVDLLFGWFGISCITTDKFCFYLQNRLIQTSQIGGQLYSATSPFSIPWAPHPKFCSLKLLQTFSEYDPWYILESSEGAFIPSRLL